MIELWYAEKPLVALNGLGFQFSDFGKSGTFGW